MILIKYFALQPLRLFLAQMHCDRFVESFANGLAFLLDL